MTEQHLNETPLIARIVAGAIVDRLTSQDDEELQQENAILLAKVKNLATKKNFNALKNKVTTKIKGSTTQRVQNIANKVKNKTIPTKTTQHLKKSTQEIAKGIISTLNGK